MISPTILLTTNDLTRERRDTPLQDLTLEDVRIDTRLVHLAEMVLLVDTRGVIILKSRRKHAGLPEGAVIDPRDLADYLMGALEAQRCLYYPPRRQPPVGSLIPDDRPTLETPYR